MKTLEQTSRHAQLFRNLLMRTSSARGTDPCRACKVGLPVRVSEPAMEPPDDDFESQYAEELQILNEDNGRRRKLHCQYTAGSISPGPAAGPPSRRFLDLRSPCFPQSEISSVTISSSVLSRKRPFSSESPLPIETSPGKILTVPKKFM